MGPGIGVNIECVVDSGNVGVMKPDPRIFQAAIDLMGLDPDQVLVRRRHARFRRRWRPPGRHPPGRWIHLGLHFDAGYERISSLAALAQLIATAPE